MDIFPIDAVLPDLVAATEASPNLILSAPPGAGKTTRVPPALLSCSWTGGGRIILLQPRRLAARAAAGRMADLAGEAVGETVGYRIRLDRRVGSRTRIECVTTGLFLRQLQGDPGLGGVAAILFDEFHERSLDGDLALALALEAQAAIRPDLRLIVMSATLDTVRVASLMPGARSVTSEGRSFPVATRHLGDAPALRSHERAEDRVARAILQAIAEEPGDVLAFLPGLAELRRVRAALEERLATDAYAVLLLHGDLPLEEQDLALRPDAFGRRKIVLATSIAETSLTIDGIRIVVDSGLKRLPHFDPATGMTRLETGRVSLAAADQRRGRAGRTAPGLCYRLWSEASERALAAFDPPEILSADLAPFALELGLWGTTDVAELALLDPPPEAAFAQARDLLHRLEALDGRHRATAHGKAMAELGTHPRLAHMMLIAKTRGQGALACDLAALLSERDPIKARAGDADLRSRLDLLEGGTGGFDRSARDRVRRAAEAWRKQLGIPAAGVRDRAAAGSVVALAYPDRIAQQRGGPGQYRLSSGKGARLAETDPLAREPFLAVATLDGDRREARIFLATPLTLAEIEEDFAAEIEMVESIAWNPRAEAVEAKTERRLWSLVLDERTLAAPPKEALAAAMLDGIRQMGVAALPWTPEAEGFRARVGFLRGLDGGESAWPDLSDAALLETLDDWLTPFLDGVSRRAHLARLDLMTALRTQLDWRQAKALDTLAPTHIQVPSGSRVAIDYSQPVPVLGVRLQEMFGAAETPCIAGGKVPLLLHLLSPARRPVQVTRDLTSFWKNGYAAVRADLRGQYPKHFWPDDPLQAEPTARTKPRPR